MQPSTHYKRRSLVATVAPGTFSCARLNGVGTRFRVKSAYALEGVPAFETQRDVIPSGLRGGVIVLTVEVNLASRGEGLWFRMRAWCNNARLAIRNRLAGDRWLSLILDELGIRGVSIGNSFRGYYESDAGKVFSEQSLAVEVLFADSTILEQLAIDLAIEFQQETVLVKDLNAKETFFLERGPPTRLKSTSRPA
jgi:hypothetical protein